MRRTSVPEHDRPYYRSTYRPSNVRWQRSVVSDEEGPRPGVRSLSRHHETGIRPRSSSMRRRSVSKLRLPSFEKLGIAVPHPDRLRNDHDGEDAERRPRRASLPSTEPVSAPAVQGSTESECPNTRQRHSPQSCVVVLTPPDDVPMAWREQRPVSGDDRTAEQRDGWLSDVLDLLASQTPSGSQGQAIRVLTQTLPKTLDHRQLRSVPGDASSPFAPSSAVIPAIDAVQRAATSQPDSHTPYIHITYAVDVPEVHMDYLPSSPPLTSGGLGHGLAGSPGYFHSSLPGTTPTTTNTSRSGTPGYFTPTVFNSVVHILPPANTQPTSSPFDLASWDAWTAQRRASPLPPANPAVPPATQDVSIVERYIPPTSPEDDQHIFSDAASPLVDRLSELTSGGTLLFLYPTRRGAETFLSQYLGPAIQPLLRGLMTRFGLPIWFCELVEKMRAVEFMKEWDALKGEVEMVCARSHVASSQEHLPGRHARSVSSAGAFVGGPRARLIHASTRTVRLHPLAWQEWWCKQERARLGSLVNQLTEIGHTSHADLMHGELERMIIAGLRHNRSAKTPTGIEVGVFLIKRE